MKNKTYNTLKQMEQTFCKKCGENCISSKIGSIGIVDYRKNLIFGSFWYCKKKMTRLEAIQDLFE
jgi:hypothetical protein